MNLMYILAGLIILIAIGIFAFTFLKKNAFANDIRQKKDDIDRNLNELKSEKLDFNSRINNEKQLKKDELTHVQGSIEALKQSIEAEKNASYMKNVFLTNVSNEIRNPLNGILGFAGLLKTDLAKLNREDLYDFSDSISQSGENMLKLLSDIIDISRIEANDVTFNLVPCSLKTAIENTVGNYLNLARQKGVEIIVDNIENPYVYSDNEVLIRIINACLDNAVRFTDKGFIKISKAKVTEQTFAFEIKDTGIGIDKSYLPLVFEPYRTETLGYSTKYQGAGLSLPLAKKALNLMEGDIIIESEKGNGTRVEIILKKSEKDEVKLKKPVVKSNTTEPPWYNKNIILVEDDKINQILFTKILAGCKNLIICGSGEDAIDKMNKIIVNKYVPDFVLMDINLPGEYNGIKLMHHLKKEYEIMRDVPYIAQTAYAMSNEKDKLIKEGFDEYISKPIKRTELIEVVENVLLLSKES